MTPADIAKVRQALRSCIDDTTEALAILDAEEKRKTRTYFRVECKDPIGWFAYGGHFDTRKRAEDVGRDQRTDFRILEVNESWEEPTPCQPR